MKNLTIVPQLETNGITRADLTDLCLASILEGAHVAAEVVRRVQKLLVGLYTVAVLTNILPVGSLLAIVNENAVYIMSVCCLSSKKASDSGDRQGLEERRRHNNLY